MSGIARAVLATAPHRFALCGLSMGGYIAFEMVRQAPDRIERLALLDTSALSDTPEQNQRRLKLIAMAQTGEFKSVRDTLWPLFVHPARHDNVALKRAVFKMMDDTGPETFIRDKKNAPQKIQEIEGAGPGTELKKLLAKLGIAVTPDCPCSVHAALMDQNGCEWCEQNLDIIVGWMREESERRGVIFIEKAARFLAKRAIAKARRSDEETNNPSGNIVRIRERVS